ncbi:hypothetical protein D3C86_1823890 [compost metagenome]
MNLYAIKTCLERIFGRLRELTDDPRNLSRCQLARRRWRYQRRLAVSVVAERCRANRLLRRGAHRQFPALLDRRMRHPTHVPDLRKHLAAHGMHRVGGEAPSSDLLGGEDAGIEEVALTFTGYRRALADDQACGGALRVVQRHSLIGGIIGCARAG